MPSPTALIPLWANFKLAMIPGLDKRFSVEALDFLQAEAGLAVAISLYRTAQGFPIVATPLNSLDLTARFSDAAADLHLGPDRQFDAPTLRFTLGALVRHSFISSAFLCSYLIFSATRFYIVALRTSGLSYGASL